MSDHDDFMEGFCDGSRLRGQAASERYASWLAKEGYSELARIDLESGGYQAGLEVGTECAEA
jgi:hypothetical protein